MATIASPRAESPAIPVRVTSPSITSASGTPSSSVRPSVDLPRNSISSPSHPQNVTATTPGGATTQRRNRVALRDYYNLKSKGASGAQDQNITRTVSITSTTSASDSTITSSAALDSSSSSLPSQLDDPTFSAQNYVSELLKSSSLRDILRTESVLVSEIRTLDGERKALVYDNYSKLIKAVGTIAEMQKGMHKREGQDRYGVLGERKEQAMGAGLDGVDGLERKLDGLLEMARNLQGEERKEVSGDGREKRRQKKMVKWALAAPGRLQRMVALGKRDEAVREYHYVTELLDKWDGVGGVEELKAECAKVMESAKEESEGEGEEGDDSG